MRIAIPDNPFFSPLLAAADQVAAEHGHTLRRCSEEECTRLLLNNMVDLALLSPLGYGQGVTNADFRIIPSTVAMLRGWTNTGSILFARHLGEVHSMVSPQAQSFLIRCAQIILDEQYEIGCELGSTDMSADQALEHNDCVLCWHTDEIKAKGLDISEEWDMSFSAPLPLALWVCRSEFILDAGAAQEELHQDLISLCSSLAGPNLQDADHSIEQNPIADTEARVGSIEWKWSESFEEALDQTLQLLYQRQLLPEIPAVKIMGRE